MSNQQPMAIEPSKEHVLDNFLNCFTFIDTEKQLVIAYPVFLHLGYTVETAQATLSKPMIRQYTNCKGFVPGEDFYISIQQIGELIVNAPKDKYIPHILEFIKNTLIPLFNTQPQIKHDDFKKETIIMTTNQLTTENQSQKFHSDLFGDLTVLTHDDGSLWFIGKEVAEKLGYARPSDAITQHCKHTVKHRIKLNQNDTRGSNMLIIPESDLYRLVMRSKLPDAEKFETWVVDEILPSIRKTGGYGQAQIEQKPEPVKTIRHTNASAMRAADRMIEKMTISDERKTLARAYLLYKEYDIPVETMLPAVTHKLNATEIGKQLGISANMVGRITNELGIKNDSALCELRLDKSPHGSKQIETCYYALSVIDMVKAKLNERKAS